MKYSALLCSLLGLAVLQIPARAQQAAPVAVAQPASPALAYSRVAAAIARLLRQATALPDAQAVALLRRESPALQAKAKQTKPAYIRWVKSLSPAELIAEQKRLEASPWYQYFAALDTSPLAVKARRNRALAEQVFNLMDFADGV